MGRFGSSSLSSPIQPGSLDSAVPGPRARESIHRGASSLERWCAAAAHAPEACVVLDREHRVMAASDAWCALMGVPGQASVQGHPLLSVLRLLDFADGAELDDGEASKIPPLLAIKSRALARGLCASRTGRRRSGHPRLHRHPTPRRRRRGRFAHLLQQALRRTTITCIDAAFLLPRHGAAGRRRGDGRLRCPARAESTHAATPATSHPPPRHARGGLTVVAACGEPPQVAPTPTGPLLPGPRTPGPMTPPRPPTPCRPGTSRRRRGATGRYPSAIRSTRGGAGNGASS